MLLLIAFVKYVGIGAGVLTAASMLPQLVKMLKEKKGNDISGLMLICLMAGLALWVWYGILKEDWPIILTNSFSFLLNLVIVILSYRYKDNKH